MLGKLVVHLQAQYGHLTAGLAAARNSVLSTVGSMRRGLGGLAAGVAGLAVVSGTIAGVATAMENLDEVGDLSSLTGNSAGAIAGLGMAAKLSGSDLETLQGGLKKFSLVVGNALGGSKSAQQDLATLGLTLRDLQTLTPDQQILKIADSIAKLPTEAQRNAAAMSVFGKAGADLAPMLSRGSAGLEEFISQAKQMGLDIPSDDLASIGAANDAIDKIKMTVSGMFGQLAVAVAPTIVAISDGILSWTAGFGGVVGIVGVVKDVWTTTQNAIATGIVYAMAVGEFAVTNWVSIAELAFTTVLLAAMKYFATVQYFYLTVLPSLFNWFTTNWSDIWHSAFDLVMTIFINLGQNIRRIMSEIWDYIASGGTDSLEFAWTPLTEGFVNSVKKLPDIPDRVIGPLEASLSNRVSELSATLGNDLGQMVDDRLAELNQMQQAQSAAALAPDASPAARDHHGSPGSGPGEAKDTSFSALAKGSAEAAAAIVAAMNPRSDEKIAQKQLQVQQQQLAAQRSLNARLERGHTLAVVESL